MKREMIEENWRENEQFVFELKESEEKIMKWNEKMTENQKLQKTIDFNDLQTRQLKMDPKVDHLFHV